MKYIVIKTETGIQGECRTPSKCDVKIYQTRGDAVNTARKIFAFEVSRLSTGEYPELCYCEFDDNPSNDCISEARVFGELAVIVICAKAIKDGDAE